MSGSEIRWKQGEPEMCARIEEAFRNRDREASPIQTSMRRSLHALSLEDDAQGSAPDAQGSAPDAQGSAPDAPGSARVVFKVFHRRPGLRGLRNNLKRAIGRSAAQREWRALLSARRQRLPVPEPVAYGFRSDGEEILVTHFVPGRSLRQVLLDSPLEWAALCSRLTSAITRFQHAGLRHGDLHAGNLRVAESGVVILDLQRTRRSRGAADQRMDLAQLAFSLSRCGVDAQGLRLFRDQLGADAALDASIQRFCRDYQRGRRRRQLRSGQAWSTLERAGNQRGLRLREFESERLPVVRVSLQSPDTREDPGSTEIRQTDRASIVEFGPSERRLISKRVPAPGLAKRIADRFRGSAGARAFRLGQADQLISDRTAPALAYLDEWRAGLPVSSRVFMQKVGEEDLDVLEPEDPDQAKRIAIALGDWLAEQHAMGLSHRDLKGGNIRVRVRRDSIQFWLVDLQDLTGPQKIAENARLEALSQLNASLSDSAFDRASRLAGLSAYAKRMPFERTLDVVVREIVRRSHARNHRWQGLDCAD